MNPLPSPDSVLCGKYRVLRLIGEGGMGAVFEAENLRTQKRVALKWLCADASQRAQASARMVREAQAAARVRHPNVVDVYDVESEGDAVFLVMEYLEGEPLTRALARRSMQMSELIALLLQAMRGVAAAHKQGVVHRDIKPDNIFLAQEGEGFGAVPKVLDFGISRLEPRGGDPLVLTRTGTTMGTPLYMSYEQLSGVKDIDARTDVYALGVILYEGLTGEPPYFASTFSELVVKIATQPVRSPCALRPDIPHALADIVLRAIARDRDQRFPTVEALMQALGPFATEAGFRAQQTDPGSPVPFLAGRAASRLEPQRAQAPTSATTLEAKQREVDQGLLVSAAQSTRPQRLDRGRRHRLTGAAIALVLLGTGGAVALLTNAPAAPPTATAGLVPVLPRPRQGHIEGQIEVGRIELQLANHSTHVTEPTSLSDTPERAAELARPKVTADGQGPPKRAPASSGTKHHAAPTKPDNSSEPKQPTPPSAPSSPEPAGTAAAAAAPAEQPPTGQSAHRVNQLPKPTDF